MGKHYYSVFNNEQELLKAINQIHLKNEGIQLDPMYYKGGFYKDFPKPEIYGDLRGEVLGIPVMDATELNIESNSIKSIILDPPFVIASRPSQINHYATKFSYFTTDDELKTFYYEIIDEAYRVLKKGGTLIFKCQDYTDTKTIMSHCLVYQYATQMGFYAKDIVILNLEKGKIANNKLNQRHFRKSHTYFWIFKK